jgi:DNA-binding NtrC family response regulator
MTVAWKIFVATSDLESRRALTTILNREGVDLICTSTIREFRDTVTQENVGLVFCEGQLADGNYRDLLAACRSMKSKVRVVVTYTDWDEYLDAIRLGAFDVIETPYRPTDVEWVVAQAQRDERDRLRRDLPVGPHETGYQGDRVTEHRA